MEKGRTFMAYGENGEIVECEVIMSYLCGKNQKTYAFYTDHSYDTDGSLNLYASIYLGEKDGEIQLEDIVDENEWSLLDDALKEAKEALNE